MQIDKYSIEGKVVGKTDLPDSIFGVEVNDRLVYDLIKAANANRRQGTHKTKERAEVRGGGTKPYRQKGTGRARHGTIRSPIWRGGGVVFGPRPRSYRIDLPKKMKRTAYLSLFSLKAREGCIKVIEDFEVGGKTREMAKIGKALSISKGVLLAAEEDAMLKRSMRNLPRFIYNNVKRISARDIFYCKDLVITESALKQLNDRYAVK